MQITGFQLMDRIAALRELAQTINSQFTASLFRFEEEAETKPDPRDVMKQYLELEKRVAALQSAQATYNTQVSIDVLGERMTLQQAVKLIGTGTRLKNNWVAASKANHDSPYSSYVDRVRDKDNQYAQRVVALQECLELANSAQDFATALKQAIRYGNAVEIEMDLDASLLR